MMKGEGERWTKKRKKNEKVGGGMERERGE